MRKTLYVYILTNLSGTLYIGMTANLGSRMEAHREGYVPGFTSKYRLNRLVYYEVCEGGEVATARERQLKKWNRARKISLIEAANPSWRDLAYHVLTG